MINTKLMTLVSPVNLGLPKGDKLQLVRRWVKASRTGSIRHLASLLSSELELDAPVTVDVRGREDRLEQRLRPLRVQ